VNANTLLLGVDGGGTRCRVRLGTAAGDRLGEATGGPANVRFGLEQSFSAVLHATSRCLEQAGLSSRDYPRIVACLALAGASEPNELRAVQKFEHPFGRIFVTNDAHAACVGAHRGRDGGVIVIGTGTVGWAELKGRHIRVGGWGMPVSDEGSGAWLGCEALRRVLWAHDGRIGWTDMLTALFRQFESNPHAIVRWATHAAPRDFATLAPVIVEHSADPVAAELMRLAAAHVDRLAARLIDSGVERLALTGGLSSFIAPFLSEATRRVVVAPSGDALDGALQLARLAADAAAA
jgi:glucosamine kinase